MKWKELIYRFASRNVFCESYYADEIKIAFIDKDNIPLVAIANINKLDNQQLSLLKKKCLVIGIHDKPFDSEKLSICDFVFERKIENFDKILKEIAEYLGRPRLLKIKTAPDLFVHRDLPLLYAKNQWAALTLTQWRILLFLVTFPSKIWNYDQILYHAFPAGTFFSIKVLHVVMSQLRKKLRLLANKEIIFSYLKGLGYSLTPIEPRLTYLPYDPKIEINKNKIDFLEKAFAALTKEIQNAAFMERKGKTYREMDKSRQMFLTATLKGKPFTISNFRYLLKIIKPVD